MDRKWKSGASVSPPALDNASDGFATAGNPGLGVQATKPGPHWYHMITEEILAFIAAAGIVFDKAVVTQLRDAAALLFDSQGVDPGGRLTLTTNVPITTTDVTAATTIRYTPHMHDRIKLYDGTRWKWYTFTELSQTLADTTKSPAAAAASKNYDMFVWDDGGTLRCTRGPLWDTGGGSNTARGTGAGSTELEQFQGRWVNKNAITNGPAARRGLYVGTVGTDASVTVNDSAANRHVWNRYNRRPRLMSRTDPASAWTYNTNAYRQANANSANVLSMIQGMVEDIVEAQVLSMVSTTLSNASTAVGVGIDSATVNSAQLFGGHAQASPAPSLLTTCLYRGYVGIGRHDLLWLENGFGASGTTTWSGSTAAVQAGITARIMG